MSATWSFGILGTGSIAQAMAQALADSKAGHLVAVASRSLEKAQAFAKAHGPAKSYGDYDALLADPDVQVVYVCTPHPQHAKWTIRALQAGKHVLCEKPLAVNQAQAMTMIEAAKRHDRLLMEAFMYRCHPQTKKLVELVKAKAIGSLRLIRATFGFQAAFNPDSRVYANALAGGGLLDVGCYPVSMARLLAGAVNSVDFSEPYEIKAAASFAPSGVDDLTTAVMKFPGEIQAQLAASVACRLDNTLLLIGDQGRIVVSDPWTADRKQGKTFVIEVHRHDQPAEKIELTVDRTAFALEVDALCQTLDEKQIQAASPAMSLRDSLGNLQTLDAWRREIGLVYDCEKPSSPELAMPWDGRSLTMLKDEIPAVVLPGIVKPVSKLIMGVDVVPNYPMAMTLLDAYFQRGGRAMDTAYGYGRGLSERMLGHWIKSRGIREQVLVITKGAHTPWCYPNYLTTHLLESLDRLQTDYVDLYFMHRDNPEVPVGEFVEVLNEHLRAGRLRAFGGSNWTVDRLDAANAYAKAHGLVGFSAISNNFSLARMVNPVWGGCVASSTPDFRAWHQRTQMPNLAWSSQARGFFTDRAGPDKKSDQLLVNAWYSDDNFERRHRAEELAKKYGVQRINVALAYVLRQQFPSLAMVGPASIDELDSCIAALNVPLSGEEVRWLNLET